VGLSVVGSRLGRAGERAVRHELSLEGDAMSDAEVAAYHEAGHAVANLHFRIGLKYVTIADDDSALTRPSH